MIDYDRDFFETVVFFINDEQVESLRLGEYLKLNTEKVHTAYGIEDKIHLRQYDLWTWGGDGSKPRSLMEFTTKEDAELGLLIALHLESESDHSTLKHFSTKDAALSELTLTLSE